MAADDKVETVAEGDDGEDLWEDEAAPPAEAAGPPPATGRGLGIWFYVLMAAWLGAATAVYWLLPLTIGQFAAGWWLAVLVAGVGGIVALFAIGLALLLVAVLVLLPFGGALALFDRRRNAADDRRLVASGMAPEEALLVADARLRRAALRALARSGDKARLALVETALADGTPRWPSRPWADCASWAAGTRYHGCLSRYDAALLRRGSQRAPRSRRCACSRRMWSRSAAPSNGTAPGATTPIWRRRPFTTS